MKKWIYTTACTITLFLPWTLLYLRTFDWALKSPTAEILIYSYAAFMIASGIFAVFAYAKGGIRHKWMQVCVAINGMYAVGAALLLLAIVLQ
ncbi:MAG: hypothetical protein K2N87_00755 [Eubacterium sp.]|nr:hypothetical protein [Eubacterium sp.]